MELSAIFKEIKVDFKSRRNKGKKSVYRNFIIARNCANRYLRRHRKVEEEIYRMFHAEKKSFLKVRTRKNHNDKICDSLKIISQKEFDVSLDFT
jgi:hypothetical protein